MRSDPEPYEEIENATLALAEMSDEALLLARAQSDALKLAAEPTDLGAILEEVARRYRDRRRIDVPATGIKVKGDRSHLVRVFDNVVGNAVKYSDDGSPVTIDVSRVDRSVSVTVTDRGRGIPPNDLGRVFEEYYRSEAVASKPGSGVGLYIVKKIVEAFGGTVSVTSVEGEGTAVCVALRRAD